MFHSSRNTILPGGVSKLSRTAVYKKRALYKRKKDGVKKVASEASAGTVTKQIGGDNNGGSRVVKVQKEPRYYPTEDKKKPLKSRKKPTSAKLRPSITPGTVLILLAGRHKGKRVVFLKQMPSGLLLVTGPYKVNGVPLRRVAQSYVVATSTRVDVSKLNIPEQVNEEMFVREKKKRTSGEGMFEENEQAYTPSVERRTAQQEVDEQLLTEIANTENLRKYMSQLFTLRKGQYPHEMNSD